MNENLLEKAVNKVSKRKKKQATLETAVAAPPLQEKTVALPLNDSEKEIISKYTEKLKSNNMTVYFVDGNEEKGEVGFRIAAPRGTEEEKSHLLGAALLNSVGANNVKFAGSLFSSCFHAVNDNLQGSQLVEKANDILTALNSFKPADEFEGMLITRLITLHFQSMAFISRTKSNDDLTIDLNINRSTKLMRLYNETLETLMRYRRKGEQKVTVQHVTIENGGKAVVGGVFEGV